MRCPGCSRVVRITRRAAKDGVVTNGTVTTEVKVGDELCRSCSWSIYTPVAPLTDDQVEAALAAIEKRLWLAA